MKNNFLILILVLVCLIDIHAQNPTQLRIDPLMLTSLKECRNITKALGNELFTGWEFQKTPVLFYRPNVQELLINFPYKPRGFSDYTGFNPLGSETIYFRNDTTLCDIDDQNTSREIDSISVLIVADPYSSMRNQFRDVVSRPKDWANDWLKGWNFIPSPYDQLQTILHEAFHVYQNKMAPDKGADESAVAQYPLLDPVNNALYVLEGNILKDALLTYSGDPASRLEKLKEFVAVRSYRQSRLDSNSVAYENLNEYVEGLAKYIQYRFLNLGERIEPINEMYYHQGFNGYRGILSKLFEDAMRNMVNVVAVNDDRFGNKYGSGPLRFKLYELGACQALLLDAVMPSWKEKIFQDTVFLTNLLEKAIPLIASERERYLEKAKQDYQYDQAYAAKLQFEQDGKKQIEQKLAGIMETKQTLIKIFYGGFVERIGLGYTPFGVTQITKRSAIYDMVPIKVLFKEGITLTMKQVIPVFVDKDKKMIAFAIPTAVSDIQPDAQNKLETNEFILTGSKAEWNRQSNTIEIQMK
jgi:hypothetical protein